MRITTKQTEETVNFAKTISHYLKEKDVLALTGELGSGKTVFVKGVALGLGIKKEKVISPSFVLMQEYAARIKLFHFDLYRIKDLRELHLIGYEEYLTDNGISVIEWADKAKELLPSSFLEINFKINKDTSRLLTLKAYGKRAKELIANFKDEYISS